MMLPLHLGFGDLVLDRLEWNSSNTRHWKEKNRDIRGEVHDPNAYVIGSKSLTQVFFHC